MRYRIIQIQSDFQPTRYPYQIVRVIDTTTYRIIGRYQTLAYAEYDLATRYMPRTIGG